ncbi:Component of a membrane-bound complex containing the Tor2p kinase [Savitreella phatthalungensis]
MLQDRDLIIHELRLAVLSRMPEALGERVFDFSETDFSNTAIQEATLGYEELIDRCESPDIPINEPQDYPLGRGLRHTAGTSSGSPASRSIDANTNKGQISNQTGLDPLLRTFTEGTLRQNVRDRRHRRMSSDDFGLPLPAPLGHNDRAASSDGEDTIAPSSFKYTPRKKHLLMMDLHRRLKHDDDGSQQISVISLRRRGISDPSMLQRDSLLVLPPQNPQDEDDDSDGVVEKEPLSGSELGARGTHLEDLGLRGEPQETVVGTVDENFLDTDAIQSLILAASLTDSDGGDTETELTNLSRRLAHPPQPLNGTPSFAKALVDVTACSSALTSMIQSSKSTKMDPLEQAFGSFDGRGEAKPLRLKVYRPSADKPRQAFSVTIRNVATVMETIGFALLCYDKAQRKPDLSQQMKDPNRWTLRIVEEDGELDEDFPALERTRPISKFSFDEFALVEATDAQIAENEVLTPSPIKYESEGTTKPATPAMTKENSREDLQDRADVLALVPSNVSQPQEPHKRAATGLTHNVKPTAKAPGSPVLVKVRLRPEPSEPTVLHNQSTILDVTTETYIGEVLDQVCKRRNLDKVMYTLRIVGTNVIAPSDRTVESLQGRNELVLVRKKATDVLAEFASPRSLTPNAPIVTAPNTFSNKHHGGGGGRIGESSLRHEVAMDDVILTSGMYQAWQVRRRQQTVNFGFMAGRHERTLAIDGEHIQISPAADGAGTGGGGRTGMQLFDAATGKTSLIHASQIITCKQSTKVPVNFKFFINKQGQTKRYDFEAHSRHDAEAIVARIRTLAKTVSTPRHHRLSR